MNPLPILYYGVPSGCSFGSIVALEWLGQPYALSRIEMHLEAVREVRFTVCGERFSFREGATIHTENSHKYGPNGGRMLLRAGGWTPIREWTDPQDWFALVLCEAQPIRSAP